MNYSLSFAFYERVTRIVTGSLPITTFFFHCGGDIDFWSVVAFHSKSITSSHTTYTFKPRITHVFFDPQPVSLSLSLLGILPNFDFSLHQ